MDPYAGVVGLVSLAVFALHGTDGILSRDLGIYAYAGQQVADGVPPYVGVLNRAGPLAHLLPGLGVALARLVGMDDLLGIRLLFLLIAVGCVVLVHLLGRDLFGSPWAGVASAAAFLSFSGFIVFASDGPREKTPMLLFLLLALLAAGRRRWLAAGFLLGLATLVLQIILTVGAPALVVAALLGEPGRAGLTACLRIAAGGAVALPRAVLYFVAVGHLHDFVEAFALINAGYTQAGPWRRRRLGARRPRVRRLHGHPGRRARGAPGARGGGAPPLGPGGADADRPERRHRDRRRLDGARLRLVAGRLPAAPPGRARCRRHRGRAGAAARPRAERSPWRWPGRWWPPGSP